MVFERVRPEALYQFTEKDIALSEELSLSFVLIGIVVGLLRMSAPNDTWHLIFSGGSRSQSWMFPQWG
ncbi:hypothetical protein D3C76_344900 [compost metagenome]